MIKLGTDETTDLCVKNVPLRRNKPGYTIICKGNPFNHHLQPLTTHSEGLRTAGAPGLLSDTQGKTSHRSITGLD